MPPMDPEMRLSVLQDSALAVSSARGERIFAELTRYLSTILHCELALIGRIVGENMRTLGVHGERGYRENFEYQLATTPCNDVVGKSFMVVPQDVTTRYPNDRLLADFGAVGYAGYPLNDSTGRSVGVLAILAKKPIINHALVEAVLKIFAVRAEAELERCAHEEELANLVEQYRSIFDAAPAALVLRDSDFRVVDVNLGYEALSGNRREDVLGSNVLHMSPQALYEQVRALHVRALRGEHVRFEAEGRRKNGDRVHTEWRGVPIQHRAEPHVLFIGQDVTARKSDEEVLRASEEQYRAIFNATSDALVLRDSEARIVDVNPAFLEMSGYTREEVIGNNPWIFARKDNNALAGEMFRRVIAGESVHFEVQGIRKDGTAIDVEMHAVPMMYRGKPHALGMARDITARKRAEAERDGLEAQLRQAQKMEAIGHLTGGIAHDFNNLLASIMGYVVLAKEKNEEREGAADAKLARYLDQALSSSRRARDLIQQMLTFSRGQRGTPRVVDLAETAARSVKLVRGSVASSIEMQTELDPGAHVLLDPVQLDQVLLNLAINARDAMGEKGKLSVAVRQAQALRHVCASCRQRFAGLFVELAVADSGPGIAPHVLERIFEPFFTTKEVGRGSGMGLATVHGIVHEHGGHIVVDRPDSGGARFRVLLPALDDNTQLAKPAAESARSGKKPRLAGKILVVDDEAPVADFMRELLSSWGIDAVATTDPREALTAFTFEPDAYDLVITDQTMPSATGLGLARDLLARRPDLPVILCTGHIDPIAQRELESAGIRGLLHKPVEPDELYGLLKAHLH
ncbi:MAG TPA: PAS domain S-box protein [Burkholderiales bacterium]|nr:PAS domain S-box protein [Burkholderiales bacterium]